MVSETVKKWKIENNKRKRRRDIWELTAISLRTRIKSRNRTPERNRASYFNFFQVPTCAAKVKQRKLSETDKSVRPNIITDNNKPIK